MRCGAQFVGPIISLKSLVWIMWWTRVFTGFQLGELGVPGLIRDHFMALRRHRHTQVNVQTCFIFTKIKLASSLLRGGGHPKSASSVDQPGREMRTHTSFPASPRAASSRLFNYSFLAPAFPPYLGV